MINSLQLVYFKFLLVLLFLSLCISCLIKMLFPNQNGFKYLYFDITDVQFFFLCFKRYRKSLDTTCCLRLFYENFDKY